MSEPEPFNLSAERDLHLSGHDGGACPGPDDCQAARCLREVGRLKQDLLDLTAHSREGWSQHWSDLGRMRELELAAIDAKRAAERQRQELTELQPYLRHAAHCRVHGRGPSALVDERCTCRLRRLLLGPGAVILAATS